MKKFVAAAIAALALPTAASAAAPVVQTVSHQLTGVYNGNSDVTYTFDKFNLAGQVLTMVELSYVADFSDSYNVKNNNALPVLGSRTIRLGVGMGSSITGNGFALADTSAYSYDTHIALGGQTRTFGTYSLSTADSDSITTGLGAYTGAGTIDFHLLSNANFDLSCVLVAVQIPCGANPTVTLKNSPLPTSNGKLTLTYYSQAAAAVPEPATWAMMLGGFGVAGMAMRRRPSRKFAEA